MNEATLKTNFGLHVKLCAMCFFLIPFSLKSQTNCQMLCNSDFENTTIVSQNSYKTVNQDEVTCWKTTASDKMIEVWGSNFLGAPAYSGNQFIELNANMVSTLYQDFTAVLSSTIQLSFAHRGRSGVDVLSVEIGPVGGPYHNFGNFSADNSKWSYHTVSYTFPATGSKNYTLRFNSISAAGGSKGVGNLLDAISVSLPTPEIKANIVNPRCPSSKDGSIELVVTGGNSPFSFKWNPPIGQNTAKIRSLTAGNYHVDIVDNYGCITRKDYSLVIENQEYNENISITACDSFYWSATKKVYTKSGVYTCSYPTSSGCDSNITLNLSMGKNTKTIETVTECDSYYWPVDQQTYTKSGVYSKAYQTPSGCDSIKWLYLTVNPKYESVLEVKSKLPFIWPMNGVEYTETGVHELNYVSSFGCDSTFILKFVLDKIDSIFIANAFTPNGDYTNETWAPKGNNIDWYESALFNRWGEQIWSGNKNQSFDGNIGNKPIPPGVYAYMVTIMNKESELSYRQGTLTLIR